MRYILSITLLILTGLSFSQTSFAQTKKELVGAWEVYDGEVNAPALDSITIAYTVALVKSFQYKFKKNGKLDYQDEIIKDAAGTWSLKGDILSFKYSFEAPMMGMNGMESQTKEHEKTMKILAVTATQMTWLEELGDGQSIKYFLKK